MDANSGDRRPADYFLAGLAATSALAGVWGILLSSAGLALTGALLLVASVACFRGRN